MDKPILRVLYAYYPNNFIFQINSTMTFYPDKNTIARFTHRMLKQKPSQEKLCLRFLMHVIDWSTNIVLY